MTAVQTKVTMFWLLLLRRSRGWFVHCVYYANQWCLKFRWFRRSCCYLRVDRDALLCRMSSGRFFRTFLSPACVVLIWPEAADVWLWPGVSLFLTVCLSHQLPAGLVFMTPALKHRAEYLSAALHCPAVIVISIDKGKLYVTNTLIPGARRHLCLRAHAEKAVAGQTGFRNSPLFSGNKRFFFFWYYLKFLICAHSWNHLMTFSTVNISGLPEIFQQWKQKKLI